MDDFFGDLFLLLLPLSLFLSLILSFLPFDFLSWSCFSSLSKSKPRKKEIKLKGHTSWRVGSFWVFGDYSWCCSGCGGGGGGGCGGGCGCSGIRWLFVVFVRAWLIENVKNSCFRYWIFCTNGLTSFTSSVKLFDILDCAN